MKSLKRIMFLLLAVAILITIPISVNAATTTNNKTTTKPSTSETTHCTNKDNHSIACGNMKKWFKNKNEIEDYLKEVDDEYFIQYENGTISYEEYLKISPYGYECWSCSYCKKWTGNFKYRDTTEPSTSHTHIWDNGTITTPATCTTKGVITYHCTECDETLLGSVPEKGHNYNKTVIVPTCVDNGYTKYVCANCDDAYVSDYINALGHSYKYIASNNGTHQKVCNNCNQITTENCSKVKDGDYEVCTICKAKYEINKPTEPSTSHTHTWDNGTVTTPATCTKKGIVTYYCNGCDETRVENIEAIGHSYKYVANNNGTHNKVCNNCDFVEIENCSKVKEGDYEICTICKTKYEITKPTEPTKPSEPSSEPSTEPSTEPTSPVEPSTEEKPSTSLKDDEKATEPSTEPTTRPNKETTTSVATTEKTTSNTKSPATGNNLEPFGIALISSCIVGCAVLMLVMYKTKCKKETE
ncbi:hypothetical protein [uncultured Clostridium sp.]|uniref:hypothetical protein n=1 Tax=uncultured Clostridium sp. TaxID=59620 RepID=UPI00272D9D44|nr:hypothetical protein [uncultured Clostridium sp.]